MRRAEGRLFALDSGTLSTLGFEREQRVIRSWNVPVRAEGVGSARRCGQRRSSPTRRRRAADARIAYGPEPLQFGDLRVPPGDGPFPLALVLHGGYWQAIYNLIHLGHLCEALREAGIASWNLEYRCVGDPGGEWPAAAEDLDARARRTSTACRFDHDGRVVLVGHSAGGQLALWAAKRGGLPVVALAPVSDVRDAVDPPRSRQRARAATWRRSTSRTARRSSCSRSACRRS